jgi:hypothetical protein
MTTSLKTDHKEEISHLNESSDRKLEILRQELTMEKQ